MSQSYPLVDKGFVDNVNAALAALGSESSIAIPNVPTDGTVFALLDDECDFLILFPSNATPATVVAAYRLYRIGLERGRRAAKWSPGPSSAA